MDVLSPDFKLRRDLDRLTDAETDLRRVRQIVPLGDTLLISMSGQVDHPLVALRADGRRFRPIKVFESVTGMWPADDARALVRSEDALWLVDATGKRARVLDLPGGLIALDVKWWEDGVRVASLVDRNARPDPGAPVLHPSPRADVTLCRYTPHEGWTDLAEVPSGCRSLSADQDVRRMAWSESVNTVPEEAQRAEIRGFGVDEGRVLKLTEGAGKAHGVLMAGDGAGLVYAANHQKKRPITTHTDLWWRPWGEGTRRRKVTAGNREIDGFGWAPDGRLWVTFQDGVKGVTELVTLKGQTEPLRGRPPVSGIAWTSSGAPAYETETADEFPAVWTGSKRLPLPQPAKYDDLRVQTVAWKSFDRTPVEGVVFERKGTPGDAPLLVRIHGGPSGTVEAVRSGAVNARHLLRAGYRVFIPGFRGSAGFGDEFLSANIGCQGEDDLQDILTGIDYLVRRKKAKRDRVGVYGGSFGGYMTIRALAMTKRFRAGVALYGFVANRWMTLETGDFTYEEEYIAPLKWPKMPTETPSDVFPHLGKITSPLLLIHGDEDPICSLSQSTVTCRTLEARGIPTGMVVYPGEGHGFRKPENRKDCARRTLGWFLKHLPP